MKMIYDEISQVASQISSHRGFPKGYTKIQYKKYMLSEDWKLKRDYAFITHGNRCEMCDSKNNLQVHHLTYKNIEHELLDDLAILCSSCHNTSHNLTSIRRVRPSRSLIRIIIAKRFGVLSRHVKSRINYFNKQKFKLYNRQPAVVFPQGFIG